MFQFGKMLSKYAVMLIKYAKFIFQCGIMLIRCGKKLIKYGRFVLQCGKMLSKCAKFELTAIVCLDTTPKTTLECD